MKKLFSAFIFTFGVSSLLAQSSALELVGYWKFDGGYNDASSYNNHGTSNNVSLAEDRFGNPNSAGFFNGVNSYVEVPNNSSLDLTTECSMSAWIYMTALNSARIIDKQTAGGGDGYSFDLNADPDQTQAFRLVAGGVNCFSPRFVELDEWMHVTAVYINGTVRLYLNGEFVKTETGAASTINTNSHSFRIGAAHPNSNKPEQLSWSGKLDDIKVYKKALTASEVLSVYNESTNGIAENLKESLFVSPNPASDYISFGKQQYDNLKVFNITGELVSQSTGYTTQFSVKDLPAGTYFVQVEYQNQLYSSKFVKIN